MQGIIKKLLKDKEFGFITVEGSEKDTFFHKDGVVDKDTVFPTLEEGQAVTFDVVETQKGPAASNLKRA